jgi:hypothetical protein
VIVAPTLPRQRELSLEHAQRCIFLFVEQCSGLLAVEIIPRKHLDFSTYLAKRARAQSVSCAEVQFPDYETKLWSPDNRNFSRKAGKHCDFIIFLTKRARSLFGACAEVKFPVYVTVLWAPDSRNCSRKALRF